MSDRLPKRVPYSYNKGPYRLSDIPKLALGTAILAGGVYGIVALMLRKKATLELEARGEIRRQAGLPAPIIRGDAVGWMKGKGKTKGGRGTYR